MVKVRNNLAGLKVNMLTVLEQAEDYIKPSGKKTAQWLCLCECGNKKVINQDVLKAGKIKSCGCQQFSGFKKFRDNRKEKNDIDLIGKTFGKLTIIERDHTDNGGKIYYKCKCECGNEIIVFKKRLISKEKQDCGCSTINYNNIKDITGQRYGKLVALYPTGTNERRAMKWMFQCDCGKTKEIEGNSVTRGNTLSCGCLKVSHGELKIAQLLDEANIFYETEKYAFNYDNDITRKCRFDFFVNNQYYIEFDGAQHYYSNNRWWNTADFVKEQKKRDEIKNQWCKEQGIPLIRIPYHHYNELTIQDLLLETSKFIV